MAVCDSCGSESSRVRSKWKENVRLPDECPNCAPQSFEKFKSVRDGQITMGHEYMPTMYKKTDQGYEAKDELLADTEADILKSMVVPHDPIAEEAIERKRATRRTKAMTGSEIEQAINRWTV